MLKNAIELGLICQNQSSQNLPISHSGPNIMLSLYILCFIIGGIFVALAALAGLDGADFDHDFDPDLEIADNDNKALEGEGIIDTWRDRKRLRLPFTSFKFWTFGSCFFGLTGIALSLLTSLSPLNVAVLAIAVGSLCGISMVWSLRFLRQGADSLVRPGDAIGLMGTVVIPFDRQSQGKVQLDIKESRVEFMAFTDEPKELARGDKVFVVEMKNHKVWVVSQDSIAKELEGYS